MTDTERDILQAAMDLIEAQNALDLGMPAQSMKANAMKRLMDAGAEHASEHDGELRIITPEAA